MNNKLILFGDQHVTHEEPFFIVKNKYFQWVVNQPFNNETNTAVFMGDFFHSNEPTPKEYEMVHYFLMQLKFKEVIILSGNGIHEYNRSKNNWAIDPLAVHENIYLVKHPTIQKIGELDILMLPWIPGKFYNDKTMKEWYENYDDIKEKEFDYVLGHFNHKEFFGHIIDISYIKTKNTRMGHIHIPDGEYVGVDTITRYDEKGIDCKLNIIDLDTGEEEFIDIPRFFDYVEVDYNEELKTDIPYFKLDVVNAPSKEKAYQKFGQYPIRNIVLAKDVEAEEGEEQSSINHFDTSFFITNYIKDKKLSKGVAEKVRSVI